MKSYALNTTQHNTNQNGVCGETEKQRLVNMHTGETEREIGTQRETWSCKKNSERGETSGKKREFAFVKFNFGDLTAVTSPVVYLTSKQRFNCRGDIGEF